MTQTGGGSAGDSPFFHLFFQIFKFRRYRLLRPAEPYAPGFGCRYALGLAAADIFSFVLGNEGKNLQYNVRNKGAHQVSASSGVQKGHIQYHYIDLFLFGEKVPLMKDFFVITPAGLRKGCKEHRLFAAFLSFSCTGDGQNPFLISCPRMGDLLQGLLVSWHPSAFLHSGPAGYTYIVIGTHGSPPSVFVNEKL